MKQEELFAMAIGVQSPWHIESINLDMEKTELNIGIGSERGSTFRYIDPQTGEEGHYKAYDTSTKTWRHMNFFQYRCYLHAQIPRVCLPDGSVKQVKAPWEGLSNGSALLFEALILQMCKVMPVHQVATMTGTYDNKLWDLLDAYTTLCREQADYSKVTKVGMDETAVRRGHDYVTIMVDMEERKTIFVSEGKSGETVKEFAMDLAAHGGHADKVTDVSCDMSPAFISGVGEHLPNADITFDKFHIVKVLNGAVDKVRREEAKTEPLLKRSRYACLKNKENMTAKQMGKYEELRLSKANLKTFKAIRIREAFQELYTNKDKVTFEKKLKEWYGWAVRCRIPQIKQAAKTIKSHWDGIVNWASSRISNGILEGFNSIFQAAKAKARGYKKTRTIKTVIYLLTGKLDYSLVNPYCATHTLL